MYLKVLIILSISHFCNYVHSFIDSLRLENEYLAKITENKKSEMDVYACKYAEENKLWWSNVCRNIIQIIRKDIGYRVGDTFINEYSKTLFMNYRPIVELDTTVCEEKIIIFPNKDGSIRHNSVEQTAINCYASAAVDTVPFRMYQYFKEISISPTYAGDIMVFKCKGNICVILELVENEKFSVFDMIPENVITEIPINIEKQMMMSMLFKDTTDIREQLRNYNQLIQRVIEKAENMDMLCDLVIGARAEYENKFIPINEKVFSTHVPEVNEIRLLSEQNFLEQKERGIWGSK